MATTVTLKHICPQCNGDGFYTPSSGEGGSGSLPCNWPGCEDGFIPGGKFVLESGFDDVMDKCNDILDKCNDILEKLEE